MFNEIIEILKRGSILEQMKQRKLDKEKKEFTAKLKHGKNWHHELYPHRYTEDPGPH